MSELGLFSAIDISATGLSAERRRMDVIANNIANLHTTRSRRGGPYRRQQVVFAEIFAERSRRMGRGAGDIAGRGVRVVGVVADRRPPLLVYNPGHPDANPVTGMVAMPNINPVIEMVDMISATRAYEANVAAIHAARSMTLKALEIVRV